MFVRCGSLRVGRSKIVGCPPPCFATPPPPVLLRPLLALVLSRLPRCPCWLFVHCGSLRVGRSKTGGGIVGCCLACPVVPVGCLFAVVPCGWGVAKSLDAPPPVLLRPPPLFCYALSWRWCCLAYPVVPVGCLFTVVPCGWGVAKLGGASLDAVSPARLSLLVVCSLWFPAGGA